MVDRNGSAPAGGNPDRGAELERLAGDSNIQIRAPAVMPNRRRCPYFAEVAQQSRNVYLFTGPDAWDRAKRRRESHGPGSALLLPPGEDPAALRWPPVPDGLLLAAGDMPRQAAVAFAALLVRDGSPLVFVVGDGFGFPVASPHWRNPLQQPREVAA